MGSFAIVEYFLRKPLFYSGSFLPEYSESYKWIYYSSFRIETTLGHPLNNGLFFSCLALACFVIWVRSALKFLAASASALSVFATIISGSRTASIAVAIGLCIGFILLWRQISDPKKASLLFISPLTVAIISQQNWFQNLLTRSQSSEGIASQNYRLDLLSWTAQFLNDYSVVGTGPGTSALQWTLLGNVYPLENGFFQLWVSLGLLATVIILVSGSYVLLSGRPAYSWIVFLPIFLYIPTTNFVESSSSFIPFVGIISILVNILCGSPDKNSLLATRVEK